MTPMLPTRLQLRTLREAAEILRCSVKTIERRNTDGKIKAIRDGRKVLIEMTEIERYIAEHRT